MSTPTKAAEIIREALEYGKQARPRSPLFDRALTLLADMERDGGPVKDVMPTYDAGLLSDYGGGNVEWWQDYLRAELNRADDFYQSWWQSAHPSPTTADAKDSLVDVQQVMRAGDAAIELWAEELSGEGWDNSANFNAAIDSWVAATKPFRP